MLGGDGTEKGSEKGTYGAFDHLAFFGHTDRSGGVDIITSSDSLRVLHEIISILHLLMFRWCSPP